MLRASLVKRLGGFSLEARLEAPRATTLVVVGESGSGKTTLLRLLAGLAPADAGSVELDGDTWYDAATGCDLPPHRRPVGYVPQDFALFPHLSVRDNVAFGLRAGGVRRHSRRGRVDAALDRFGIAELAARDPAGLSGGQQQRVALARALVLEPALLLLDEPLAALDPATRRGVRGELRRLLASLGCTTVFVTHHPIDAMVFGDTIAVLESGRVTQTGTREALLRQPRSGYVAEFLGVNLWIANATEPAGDGLTRALLDGGSVLLVAPPGEGPLHLLVNPREIVVSRDRPAGSSLNVLEGAVDEIVPEPPAGERVRVTLATRPPIVAELTHASAAGLGVRPGDRVFASFKATGVQAFR